MSTTTRMTRLVGVVFLLHLLISTPFVAAQGSSAEGTTDEPAVTNTTCPILEGEEVDPDVYTDYKGQRIYFCCRKCRRQFLDDPTAYAEQVAAVMPASLKTDQAHDDGTGSGDARDEHAEDAGAPPAEPTEHQHTHADEPELDHAHDHGTSPLARLGRFHVVVIHFPIALLLMAALLEVAGLLRTSWRSDRTVRILIGFGAVAAVVAMALGLIHGMGADYPGFLGTVFWWHRALGIATAAAAVLTWLLVERRYRVPHAGRGVASGAVLLTAALVAATGHFGGSLVFGWNFLIP